MLHDLSSSEGQCNSAALGREATADHQCLHLDPAARVAAGLFRQVDGHLFDTQKAQVHYIGVQAMYCINHHLCKELLLATHLHGRGEEVQCVLSSLFIAGAYIKAAEYVFTWVSKGLISAELHDAKGAWVMPSWCQVQVAAKKGHS